jgi:hypothetical protein
MTMGTINHTALILTSLFVEKITEAHKVAVSIFGELATPLIPYVVNEGMSFMIAPDGSKEGWSQSDNRDHDQAEFISWVNDTFNYIEEGERNQFIEMVEVTFGEYDKDGKVSVPSNS